jgi:hypothetical protein
MVKADAKALTDSLRGRIAQRSQVVPQSPVAAAQAAPDFADQLQKPAAVRAAGILTQEEFEAKKADIRSRG